MTGLNNKKQGLINMNKFGIMLIGVLAIGMFLLPSVISTFSGSHDYVAPENVECEKCHDDVYAELLLSADDHTHANTNWTEKQVFDCLECHTVDSIGDNPGAGHAARIVDCAICHDKDVFEAEPGSAGTYSDWAHAPTSVGFTSGLLVEYGMACTDCHRSDSPANKANMFLDDVYTTINDTDAAHYTFYVNSDAVGDDLLGTTESCVGCHTHVEFDIDGQLGYDVMTYDAENGTFGHE